MDARFPSLTNIFYNILGCGEGEEKAREEMKMAEYNMNN